MSRIRRLGKLLVIRLDILLQKIFYLTINFNEKNC